MYICICNEINDNLLNEAISNGLKTFEEMKAFLKLSSACGRCEDFARELINNKVQNILASEKVLV